MATPRRLPRREASEVFFAPTGERGETRVRREAHAKAFCATCPVSDSCLVYALATREPYGVWGGLSETERAALLHSNRAPSDQPETRCRDPRTGSKPQPRGDPRAELAWASH